MRKYEKGIRSFLLAVVFVGVFVLVVALAVVAVKFRRDRSESREREEKVRQEYVELEKEYSSTLSDKEKAAELVRNFIATYFSVHEANREESMKEIKDMVSDKLYAQIRDEDFSKSEYTIEITSAPLYTLVDEKRTSRYSFCSIISLQLKSGMKDYGIHMQIWNFICGYSGNEMRILDMEQVHYMD